MNRAIRQVLISTGLGMMGACASQPASDDSSLDPRLAWPCDRLTVTWLVDSKQLQNLVGDRFVVTTEEGSGRLQLSILTCRPVGRSKAQPLEYAYLSVPIRRDSVPMVITSMPDDGWYAMTHLMSSGETAELLNSMRYSVTAASVSMNLEDPSDLEARLTFADGSIAIRGKVKSALGPQRATQALVTGSMVHLSAFFGPEEANQTTGITVDTRVEGGTPLSGVQLAESPTRAVRDRDLISDRLFWWLPTGN